MRRPRFFVLIALLVALVLTVRPTIISHDYSGTIAAAAATMGLSEDATPFLVEFETSAKVPGTFLEPKLLAAITELFLGALVAGTLRSTVLTLPALVQKGRRVATATGPPAFL